MANLPPPNKKFRRSVIEVAQLADIDSQNSIGNIDNDFDEKEKAIYTGGEYYFCMQQLRSLHSTTGVIPFKYTDSEHGRGFSNLPPTSDGFLNTLGDCKCSIRSCQCKNFVRLRLKFNHDDGLDRYKFLSERVQSVVDTAGLDVIGSTNHTFMPTDKLIDNLLNVCVTCGHLAHRHEKDNLLARDQGTKTMLGLPNVTRAHLKLLDTPNMWEMVELPEHLKSVKMPNFQRLQKELKTKFPGDTFNTSDLLLMSQLHSLNKATNSVNATPSITATIIGASSSNSSSSSSGGAASIKGAKHKNYYGFASKGGHYTKVALFGKLFDAMKSVVKRYRLPMKLQVNGLPQFYYKEEKSAKLFVDVVYFIARKLVQRIPENADASTYDASSAYNDMEVRGLLLDGVEGDEKLTNSKNYDNFKSFKDLVHEAAAVKVVRLKGDRNLRTICKLICFKSSGVGGSQMTDQDAQEDDFDEEYDDEEEEGEEDDDGVEV